MTDTQLLTDTLRDWSQEAAVPHDLADRALAGRRTARRRRAVPLLAGLATATAVLVGLAAAGTWAPPEGSGGARRTVPAGPAELRVSTDTEHQPPQTLVAAGDVAVSAIVTTRRDPVGTDGWETLRRSYSLLNPTSHEYEPTDWSYVAVAPGLRRAAVLEGDLPAAKVGILDMSSGTVTRWIPTDHPVASLAWSPDGTKVLATAYSGDPDLEKPHGKDSYETGDAVRTGFVVVDPGEATATFTALPQTSMFGGRADLGWTPNGMGVWSPSSAPDELFYDLDGRPAAGDRTDLNSNLYINAAGLPITSPDGRFRFTQDSGLPTEITDTRSGETYRQPALQLLGWADDEHVVTLAGCSDPCQGTDEFKNGLVLMRYDGTDPVPLSTRRKGDGDWGFQLTPR